jgi:hypothetical protein
LYLLVVAQVVHIPPLALLVQQAVQVVVVVAILVELLVLAVLVIHLQQHPVKVMQVVQDL